jgi:hypothetical protein
MNRTIPVIVVGLLVVAAAIAFYSVREQSAPGETFRVIEAPARSPRPAGARPTPAPGPSIPEPARRTRRAAGREAAAASEAAVIDTPSELGSLRIETDVPGAQVFLDRQFVGAAPVTAENLKPGTHQLNVSAEGFEGIAQTIDVEPGPREITIRLREVR